MSLRAYLQSVNWLRVMHLGVTWARALREDPELSADDQLARGSAERLRGLGERLARQSVGCTGVSDCRCAVCAELGRPS